jgi:hypothetical protein
MPKFNVYGVVTGTKFLGVYEADTKEAAIEAAINGDNAFVSLCHQCNDECEDPEIASAVAEEIGE